MEIITKKINLMTITQAQEKYFDEHTLFFDIECTGLSPRKAFIYLIGCATRKGNEVTTTQLFAESEADEQLILIKFEEMMHSYNSLLGFNSTRFDESFILERCRKYKINTIIKSMPHKDLYLAATKTKCLLNLPNYKQKTLEAFLGIDRDDKYNGGELIPVYLDYITTGAMVSKDLVLLHNYEDVVGMINVIEILNYVDLLECKYTCCQINRGENTIEVLFNIDITLPSSIEKIRDYGTLNVQQNCISLKLNVINTELYTYLKDYKNYYHLLNEDIIIPKIIGQSISPDLRENANKYNCRIKATDFFIKMPGKIELSNTIKVFKESYDSKDLYIRANDITEEVANKILKYVLKH